MAGTSLDARKHKGALGDLGETAPSSLRLSAFLGGGVVPGG